jgi:hypothetical protein
LSRICLLFGGGAVFLSVDCPTQIKNKSLIDEKENWATSELRIAWFRLKGRIVDHVIETNVEPFPDLAYHEKM